MTLHLAGLPWTELTKEWEAEAFTARTRVLASMLAKYGKVIVYGGEQHETRGTEYVPVHDRSWQKRHWPTLTNQDVFSDYDPMRPPWIEFNVHVADAIRKRAVYGDVLGITMGVSMQMLQAFTNDIGLIPVEVGVGYKGVLPETHRVYESWAWRFYHAGLAVGIATATGDKEADQKGDVRNFDAVIPRAYEVDDFPAGDGKGGYFVFMGRVVGRKGVMVAAQTCQRLGAKLLVVGPGVAKTEPGRITAQDGSVMEGDVEYVGVVGPEARAKLLGGAIATFTPTLYLEPFGGVHAESLLVGTPVLTDDWGCFHEYIEDGVNGFNASMMSGFVDGAMRASKLDRSAIRARAIARYGVDAVGPQYDAHLNRLRTLRREGWYEVPPRPVAA